MERLGLLVLIACAAIGFAASPGEGVETSAAIAPATQAAAIPPAVSAAPPDAPDPDAEVSRQILERFAVRHTALPVRERERLARVIVEEARLHDLPPDLVMAVIEVESAGYHLAESHVGALGLMQLLPSTGRELAEKMGIPWKGPDTLFDPVINVRLGTAYLRELADRYDGNVDTALAAYNWGPGRIDRRLRRGARVPSLYIEQVRRAVDRYAAIPTTAPRAPDPALARRPLGPRRRRAHPRVPWPCRPLNARRERSRRRAPCPGARAPAHRPRPSLGRCRR